MLFTDTINDKIIDVLEDHKSFKPIKHYKVNFKGYESKFLKEIATYNNGVLHGEFMGDINKHVHECCNRCNHMYRGRYYDYNIVICNFNNGKFHDKCIKLNDIDVIIENTNFINGVIDGDDIDYYSRGGVNCITKYENGIPVSRVGYDPDTHALAYTLNKKELEKINDIPKVNNGYEPDEIPYEYNDDVDYNSAVNHSYNITTW